MLVADDLGSALPAGRTLLAVAVVAIACVGGCAAAEMARRSRNWLYLVIVGGAVALAAGVAAQRTFPSDGAVHALGDAEAQRLPVGPWDAGVSLPLLGTRVTPVALGGVLAGVAGVSLVLFFEPAGERPRPAASRPRRLEEDDLV